LRNRPGRCNSGTKALLVVSSVLPSGAARTASRVRSRCRPRAGSQPPASASTSAPPPGG
jgi:hypothetical protein